MQKIQLIQFSLCYIFSWAITATDVSEMSCDEPENSHSNEYDISLTKEPLVMVDGIIYNLGEKIGQGAEATVYALVCKRDSNGLNNIIAKIGDINPIELAYFHKKLSRLKLTRLKWFTKVESPYFDQKDKSVFVREYAPGEHLKASQLFSGPAQNQYWKSYCAMTKKLISANIKLRDFYPHNIIAKQHGDIKSSTVYIELIDCYEDVEHEDGNVFDPYLFFLFGDTGQEIDERVIKARYFAYIQQLDPTLFEIFRQSNSMKQLNNEYIWFREKYEKFLEALPEKEFSKIKTVSSLIKTVFPLFPNNNKRFHLFVLSPLRTFRCSFTARPTHEDIKDLLKSQNNSGNFYFIVERQTDSLFNVVKKASFITG